MAEECCKTIQKKQPKANIAVLESFLSSDVISLGLPARSFLHLHFSQPSFVFLTHFLVQFNSTFVFCSTFSSSGGGSGTVFFKKNLYFWMKGEKTDRLLFSRGHLETQSKLHLALQICLKHMMIISIIVSTSNST